MFAKLLKHELRSTGAVMGVLSLAAVGVSAAAAVILRILVNYGDAMMESDSAATMVPIVLIVALGAMLLGLLVYAAGGGLVVLLRFYRSKFTDEGYLTFTLPVGPHSIFLSSLITVLIWNTVIAVVSMGGIFCIILFGTATNGLVDVESLRAFASDFGMVFGALWDLILDSAGWAVFASILGWIIQILAEPILMMTSIVLGASLAKKYKLLIALAIYYGISALTSTLFSIISAVSAAISLSNGGYSQMLDVSIYIQPVLYLALGIGAYFLSINLMGKKLNLS